MRGAGTPVDPREATTDDASAAAIRVDWFQGTRQGPRRSVDLGIKCSLTGGLTVQVCHPLVLIESYSLPLLWLEAAVQV